MHPNLIGKLASVLNFTRAGGRCPAQDFLSTIEKQMGRKFSGQFDALSKMGALYENHQRFTPLRKDGKPLWEFKEHDHRLYCSRAIVSPNTLTVILFNGWIKDKAGKTERESREIEKAIDLYGEYLREFPEGSGYELLDNTAGK